MKSKRGRLDRFIAKHQNISMKDVRQRVAQGRVRVDGQVVRDVQQAIDEFSFIVLDDETLQQNKRLYFLLNKPAGIVSATKDVHHKTAVDLISHPLADELHIVGRLDRRSTGLLLLTNDSQWSIRINSTTQKIKKHYRVTLRNPITADYVQAFHEGFFFEPEQRQTEPAELTILSDNEADVVITEGMYHQIKRMFGRFRNEVLVLHRYQIGGLQLPKVLSEGQFLEMSPYEAEQVFE